MCIRVGEAGRATGTHMGKRLSLVRFPGVLETQGGPTRW
jgi:hypothetical protein